MAVEHGMGIKERAIDFCPYMTEVMYMNGLYHSFSYYILIIFIIDFLFYFYL